MSTATGPAATSSVTTAVENKSNKRTYGEVSITSSERKCTDDSWFLPEVVVSEITYKPEFAKSKAGGDLCYANYKNGRIFLEMGPVVLGYSGLGKYIPTDPEEIAAMKKPHNDWSITLFTENNPEITPFFEGLDNNNVKHIASNSLKKTFFNKVKDEETVRENLYNPIIKVNHSTKGTIPPQIKFKVPVNQQTGLPVTEIWSHDGKLCYRHFDNDKDNLEDANMRKAANFGEWEHPTSLLKGGENVFIVVQYTGLFKSNGKMGATFKVIRFQKMESEKRAAQPFRTRIIPNIAKSDETDSAQPSPSKKAKSDDVEGQTVSSGIDSATTDPPSADVHTETVDAPASAVDTSTSAVGDMPPLETSSGEVISTTA